MPSHIRSSLDRDPIFIPSSGSSASSMSSVYPVNSDSASTSLGSFTGGNFGLSPRVNAMARNQQQRQQQFNSFNTNSHLSSHVLPRTQPSPKLPYNAAASAASSPPHSEQSNGWEQMQTKRRNNGPTNAYNSNTNSYTSHNSNYSNNNPGFFGKERTSPTPDDEPDRPTSSKHGPLRRDEESEELKLWKQQQKLLDIQTRNMNIMKYGFFGTMGILICIIFYLVSSQGSPTVTGIRHPPLNLNQPTDGVAADASQGPASMHSTPDTSSLHGLRDLDLSLSAEELEAQRRQVAEWTRQQAERERDELLELDASAKNMIIPEDDARIAGLNPVARATAVIPQPGLSIQPGDAHSYAAQHAHLPHVHEPGFDESPETLRRLAEVAAVDDEAQDYLGLATKARTGVAHGGLKEEADPDSYARLPRHADPSPLSHVVIEKMIHEHTPEGGTLKPHSHKDHPEVPKFGKGAPQIPMPAPEKAAKKKSETENSDATPKPSSSAPVPAPAPSAPSVPSAEASSSSKTKKPEQESKEPAKESAKKSDKKKKSSDDDDEEEEVTEKKKKKKSSTKKDKKSTKKSKSKSNDDDEEEEEPSPKRGRKGKEKAKAKKDEEKEDDDSKSKDDEDEDADIAMLSEASRPQEVSDSNENAAQQGNKQSGLKGPVVRGANANAAQVAESTDLQKSSSEVKQVPLKEKPEKSKPAESAPTEIRVNTAEAKAEWESKKGTTLGNLVPWAADVSVDSKEHKYIFGDDVQFIVMTSLKNQALARKIRTLYSPLIKRLTFVSDSRDNGLNATVVENPHTDWTVRNTKEQPWKIYELFKMLLDPKRRPHGQPSKFYFVLHDITFPLIDQIKWRLDEYRQAYGGAYPNFVGGRKSSQQFEISYWTEQQEAGVKLFGGKKLFAVPCQDTQKDTQQNKENSSRKE